MNELSDERIQTLRRLLFAQRDGSVYAVLDAARSTNLFGWIGQCGMPARTLYAGTAAITLAEQAPYIVQLQADNPEVDYLLLAGWGKALGLFFHGTPDFDAMRIQLKKKLVVRDPRGRRLYFRFYDPRVARAFLATADRQALHWWFEADIQRCVIEDAEGGALVLQRQIGNDGRITVHRQAIPPAKQLP